VLAGAFALAVAVALPASPPRKVSSVLDPDPGGPSAARPAEALVAAPAYYRPVIVGGKAFPLTRSNFLSLIEILDDWHAPRLRFIGGKWQLVGVHEGIDILAERGTPIVSMEPGTVENLGWQFYSGTRVGVRGVDGRYYFYAHLSAVAPGIVIGARVSAGTLLGLVGNTGYGPPGHRDEFPPHLHFGLEVGTQWVDPYATLVSLYTSTTAADHRTQAGLDRLAEKGSRAAWDHAVESVLMNPGITPRE
jgi:murein DD-endopeptidase MepM/ murein hydrolase activator NlpD